MHIHTHNKQMTVVNVEGPLVRFACTNSLKARRLPVIIAVLDTQR